MYCTQCGCKIEDGYKFCPECGEAIKSVENIPKELEATLEDIMLDVAKRYPPNSAEAIGELSWVTGIGKTKLAFVMSDVWNGHKPSRIKEYPAMERKYNKYKMKTNTDICPRCGSQNIEEIHKPGMIISRQSSAFKSMVISSQTEGVDMMLCQRCGYKWIPKKRK